MGRACGTVESNLRQPGPRRDTGTRPSYFKLPTSPPEQVHDVEGGCDLGIAIKMLSQPTLLLVLALGGAASAFNQAQFMPQSNIANAGPDVAAPIVDLGYSQYQGFYNPTFNINAYKG